MAKKKQNNAKANANTTQTTPTKKRSFLRNERLHFVVGLFFLMVFFFLAFSFISFLFYGGIDQSKVENLSLVQLGSINNQVLNWGGGLGAYLSNLFINRWMGLSAFFVCFFILTVAIRLMKIRKVSVLNSFMNCSFFIIWGSVTIGFLLMDSYQDNFLYLGGHHGYYVSQLLQASFGWIGTFILSFGILLLYLVITSKNTIPVMQKIFSFSWLKRKKKELIEEEEEANISEEENEDQDKSLGIENPEQPLLTLNDTYATESEKAEEQEPENTAEETPITFTMEAVSEDPITPESNEDYIIEKAPEEEVFQGNTTPENEDYDPTLDLSNYQFPGFDLLNKYDETDIEIDKQEQQANINRITETLNNYGIRIKPIKATVGPTITLYEIIPEAGIRISKIKNLEDDIALSLSALAIRIIAPIPGKGTIGIEVPNKEPKTVSMHSVITSKKFQECRYELPIAFGKTITNEIFMADLAKMPHILVAGATGQGKSVGLNAIISSLLYKKHPSQLKFVLIDPKKVEFSIYSRIEMHFLAKLPDTEKAIITDVTKVVQTLNSVVKEMEERYKLLEKSHKRNIKEYNTEFIARKLNPNNGHRYMPYIVVIVDEFGDLIMTAGKEIELPIARIAQMARAVGIHMIIATQRPSTNIITGIIKANFPARVAFKVSSMIDSRTILDCPGANQLVGRGDMLFSAGSDLVRVQCAFIDTPEVEKIGHFIGDQQGYPTAYLLPEYVAEGSENGALEVDLRERDPMFEDAARLIVLNQQGSTSLIQRKFAIGYNRAGRLMDQLEAAGIVGPYEGSKARQVLVMDEVHLENVLSNLR